MKSLIGFLFLSFVIFSTIQTQAQTFNEKNTKELLVEYAKQNPEVIMPEIPDTVAVYTVLITEPPVLPSPSVFPTYHGTLHGWVVIGVNKKQEIVKFLDHYDSTGVLYKTEEIIMGYKTERTLIPTRVVATIATDQPSRPFHALFYATKEKELVKRNGAEKYEYYSPVILAGKLGKSTNEFFVFYE